MTIRPQDPLPGKVDNPVGSRLQSVLMSLQPRTVMRGNDGPHIECTTLTGVEVAESALYHPQTLAKRFKISLRQLERRFHEEFNCTPRTWLNQMRMAKACMLLLQSGSVKEVG